MKILYTIEKNVYSAFVRWSTGFPCYPRVELSYETFPKPKWQSGEAIALGHVLLMDA